MVPPSVTFVIATYKRARALRCTLRALCLQRHEAWTALVIGDQCGPETAEAVRAVADPRIRYYNLPQRFGEQSGPNTAGLHLVTSEFIAFLNHDDLLLPDHLDLALSTLAADGADFYIGRCGDVRSLNRRDDGTMEPVVTRVIPADEDLRVLATWDRFVFDPSSFWVIRTAYAKRVGGWRRAGTLWRTPLRDWIMRAWRLGGRFSFGTKVSALRFWTQNLRRDAPLYTHETPEHEYLLAKIERESPDVIRAAIAEQLAERRQRRSEAAASNSSKRRDAGRSLAAWLYLRCGIDAFSVGQRIKGRPPGEYMQLLSRRRVGQALPEESTLDLFLKDPERYRVI